jgi:hypothetical protein
VADAEQERDPEYHYDYASEAGSDDQDAQDGDQDMEGEDVRNSDQEMESKEERGREIAQEDVVDESQEQASASPEHRRHSASISIPNGTAHPTRRLGFDTSTSIPDMINATDESQRTRDLGGAAPTAKKTPRRAPLARSRPRQIADMPTTDRDPLLMDSFTHLVWRLHAWSEIPMVHSKSVDRSTNLRVVSTRTILSGPAKAENIFVSTNSQPHPFAARVYSAHFHDHTTNQYGEVDVLPASEAVAGQRGQSRPVISEEDMKMVPGQGLTFQPSELAWQNTTSQTGGSYPSHVVFTGGKRVVVDIVHQPAVNEATPRRLDILDFLS